MFFIPIPSDVQMVVKKESSLTGKSVRQIIMDKLRKETTEKVYSAELVSNLNKLDEIQKLPKNWNGNGASRIQRKLIKKSKSLLINLDKQPQIFPTANNSIQIEYDGQNGAYLEFQISKCKNLEFYKVSKDGSEESGFIPCTSFSVNKVLEEFFG